MNVGRAGECVATGSFLIGQARWIRRPARPGRRRPRQRTTRPGRGRRFITAALSHGCRPVEVTIDKAPTYPRVVVELLPPANHIDGLPKNNRVESGRRRLKARLR